MLRAGIIIRLPNEDPGNMLKSIVDRLCAWIGLFRFAKTFDCDAKRLLICVNNNLFDVTIVEAT